MPGGRKTFLPPEMGTQGQHKSVQTNLIKLTLIFLVTFPQLTALAQIPLSFFEAFQNH